MTQKHMIVSTFRVELTKKIVIVYILSRIELSEKKTIVNTSRVEMTDQLTIVQALFACLRCAAGGHFMSAFGCLGSLTLINYEGDSISKYIYHTAKIDIT